jgi:phosphopantothenoylcysteine decarboxylase / phosphopantothenate---cysteine ligase
MLQGKTIVVGVCGGIAVYKVVEVVSRLKKLGANVHVIMTKHAMEFVTPLTFQTMSGNPVVKDLFEEPKMFDIAHISLAEKADLILVAPATANMIGKVANGICDDMLSTTIMASLAKILFIPAMNTNMYENPVVQDNIKLLTKRGMLFMEPDEGKMACGTTGKGRLPESQKIVAHVEEVMKEKRDLEGVQVLVTAGPTRESIDPVRYISNRSSGKMGYAIAKAAFKRGANVILISGPCNLDVPIGVDAIFVESALEMHEQVMKRQAEVDVFIMVAAVSDYRVKTYHPNKMKKKEDSLEIELVKNPDIAKEIGQIKGNRTLIGFCAETEALMNAAQKKLIEKNMDMIVANDVTLEGAGFGSDTNIVKLLKKDASMIEVPCMDKHKIADLILDHIDLFRNQK